MDWHMYVEKSYKYTSEFLSNRRWLSYKWCGSVVSRAYQRRMGAVRARPPDRQFKSAGFANLDFVVFVLK